MKEIAPREGWEQGRYALLASSATVEKEWTSFLGRAPDAGKATFEHLTARPRDHTPQRQFPLKGKELKPFWEYEASAAERLWYAVSEHPPQVILIGVRSNIHRSQKTRELVGARKPAVLAALKKRSG